MKNKIILLLFGMFAFVADVVAAETSRYVEFARTYGIVRYFSPNPYTQDWSESDWMKVCALLADRAETQSLETLFSRLPLQCRSLLCLFRPRVKMTHAQVAVPCITAIAVRASSMFLFLPS